MPGITRAHRIALVALALGTAAACGDDAAGPDDPGAGLATIRLTIGGMTVNLTAGGAGAAVDIPQGNTPVSAVFLDAGGGEVALDVAEFELRIVSSNTTRLRFVRLGAFTGTLEASELGTIALQVSLFHLDDDHADFGPQNLTVTVQ